MPNVEKAWDLRRNKSGTDSGRKHGSMGNYMKKDQYLLIPFLVG
jgi:hypothetical protein